MSVACRQRICIICFTRYFLVLSASAEGISCKLKALICVFSGQTVVDLWIDQQSVSRPQGYHQRGALASRVRVRALCAQESRVPALRRRHGERGGGDVGIPARRSLVFRPSTACRRVFSINRSTTWNGSSRFKIVSWLEVPRTREL